MRNDEAAAKSVQIRSVDALQHFGHFPRMSTLIEIEEAIEHLPPEQWAEIRRWIEVHPRTRASGGEAARFDEWLAASTGIAKGKLTTDERMRETREGN